MSSSVADFGHELLPQTIAGHRVQAHLFDGYWEDIGTVGAFHQANIELTRDEPRFDFASEAGPIFTRPRFLPCSRIAGATVKNSLICDGMCDRPWIGDRKLSDRGPGPDCRKRDDSRIAISWGSTSSRLAQSLLENQRLGRPAARASAPIR